MNRESVMTRARDDPEPVLLTIFSALGREAEIPRLLTMLSGSERARFSQRHGRENAVVTRATLRQVLSSLLGTEPGGVVIENDAHGRPRAVTGRRVEFSVTHTAHVGAIVATTGQLALGIDLEWRGRVKAWTDHAMARMARRCLTTDERTEFDTLRDDEKRNAFLRAWTRKEALLKALGTGLTTPMRHVHLGLGDIPDLRHLPPPAQGWAWRLLDIDVRHTPAACEPAGDTAVPRDFLGAIAVGLPRGRTGGLREPEADITVRLTIDAPGFEVSVTDSGSR